MILIFAFIAFPIFIISGIVSAIEAHIHRNDPPKTVNKNNISTSGRDPIQFDTPDEMDYWGHDDKWGNI
jgi:hypothetical protein